MRSNVELTGGPRRALMRAATRGPLGRRVGQLVNNDKETQDMSITPMCKHCGRLIRIDSRAYAANGGFYHWECTEPAPALHIARVEMSPGDAVAVLLDKTINTDQRRHIASYVANALDVKRVVVLDGGIGLSVVAHHEQPNV